MIGEGYASGQIEWFKNQVENKSVNVGGQQVIHVLEGYSTHLVCKMVLLYIMFLGKTTDHDLANFPHVTLTSPYECDPTVIDYVYPSDNGEPT